MAQYTLNKAFNYLKLKDILHVFLAVLVFPFAIISKIFIRNFWLVCEDKNEARDNGYWFYKWVRENRPKQKIAYVINKKSVDYQKVKGLGKIVSYGTIAHWFWYIVADKNISSQKGGKPNAAACYLFEVVFKLRRNNRVFLQHGVTINKGAWLFYPNTYFRLFITATENETDYVKQNFGYPDGYVQMLGFSRFDQLHNVEVDKDLILIMPTWRSWLARESKDNRDVVFTDTEYYKQWNGLLNDPEFIGIIERYGKRVMFYPHRNMQKYLSYFSVGSKNIEIADWKKYDIQAVLKKAAVMITDYSSVFFDFAYMKKPVLFYQFDETEYRQKQYSEGYFDYHKNNISEWFGDKKSLIEGVERTLTGQVHVDEAYIDKEFGVSEKPYSEKIYDGINSIRRNK